MTLLALNAIQQGLYSKLSGDGVLMGMVTGVYDAVPPNTALPYVVIGDGSGTGEASDVALSTCALTLHVWTDASGRKTALTIMNRIYGLIHQGTLSLSGFDLLLMRCERSQTSLSAQGNELHGTLTVSLMVAEQA